MRKREIDRWVESLTRSFNIKAPMDPAPLLALYHQEDYAGMLRLIRKQLSLEMPLRIGYAKSGGPPKAMAWINLPVPMPLYGTQEFRASKLTVYIRKEYIEEMPFAAIVAAMAHELSHVVLAGLGHRPPHQEEMVDLTAMLLGFRDFYLQQMTARIVTLPKSKPRSWFQRLFGIYPIPKIEIAYENRGFGYLSEEERRYAASLMRR